VVYRVYPVCIVHKDVLLHFLVHQEIEYATSNLNVPNFYSLAPVVLLARPSSLAFSARTLRASLGSAINGR